MTKSARLKKAQKSCECDVCRGACVRKPGWFLPGEAEKAAQLMKMSLQDFFDKYLGVDWWNGSSFGEETFLLSPAITDSTPGDLFEQNPLGRCVFYVNDKCLIHDAKPYECRMYWHGDGGGSDRHQATAMAWKDHQKQVAALLGRPPMAPEFTMFDMLSAALGMLR
jgi:Fe-S-cluster containining protein